MPRPMMILARERQPGQQVSPIREQNVARGRPDRRIGVPHLGLLLDDAPKLVGIL